MARRSSRNRNRAKAKAKPEAEENAEAETVRQLKTLANWFGLWTSTRRDYYAPSFSYTSPTTLHLLFLLLVLLLLLLFVESVTHIIMALVLRRHASNMPQLALLALMPLATPLRHPPCPPPSLSPSLTLAVIPRACFLCLVPQTALDFHMNEPRRAEPGYLFVCLSWPLSSIHPPSIPILLFLLCLPHWLMRKYAFHRSVASVCCPRFELVLNISHSFCLKSAQYLSI